MFGYAPEALVGQHVNTLLVQDEALLTKHKLDIASYLKDPTIRQMNKGLIVQARYADGTNFHIAVSLGFHDTESGRYAIACILLADKP